jgi:hypothetical protein
MSPDVYRSREFLSKAQIKTVMTKVQAYYGELYIAAVEEADHFGELKGEGEIPKLEWGTDVRLLRVYANVELKSEDCREREFTKMLGSFIRSGLLSGPNTALTFFSIDGAFNVGRKKRESADFTIGAQIEKSADTGGILYQFRHGRWSKKGSDPEQEASTIQTVIERAGLPMTLNKVKGKYILSAPDESGAIQAGSAGELQFNCFLRDARPEQLAKSLCTFAEAVADRAVASWSWSINQDEDPNEPDKAARVYTWASDQDFSSYKHEISLSYQIKGLEALGFLKSIAGPKGALDVEVAQVQWPDDWYAILKVRATHQGYIVVIEIQHDELKKIVAELKRVTGIQLIED